MKKTVFKFGAALALALCVLFSLSAQQTLSLDLSKSLNPATFTFNPQGGQWTETYNEDYPMIEFENFAFSHLINANSYGGSSWDGFTVCTSGDNSNQSDWFSNAWGNMAGGGIKTDESGNVLKNGSGKVQVQQGLPYLLAYWSFYTDLVEDFLSTQTILTVVDAPYEAVGVYVNVSPWVYYSNLNGDGYARALDRDGDYFKLIFHGLDENYEDNEGATVEHYFAKNEGGGLANLKQSPDWEWVDLSPLGEVYGFYYTMETTDMSYGFPNTATYFCMDKLTVKAPQSAGIKTPAVGKALFALYPNPAKGYTSLYLNDLTGSVTVKIIDLNGRIVGSENFQATTGLVKRLEIGNLSKGVYFVQLQSVKGNAVQKLIVR